MIICNRKPYLDCRIYGPYLRKDNRRHVIVIYPNGRRQTVSYPRYLFAIDKGFEMPVELDAHHVNENVLDNTKDNLNEFESLEHKAHHALKYEEINYLHCVRCWRDIILSRVQMSNLARDKSRGRSGPYCISCR